MTVQPASRLSLRWIGLLLAGWCLGSLCGPPAAALAEKVDKGVNDLLVLGKVQVADSKGKVKTTLSEDGKADFGGDVTVGGKLTVKGEEFGNLKVGKKYVTFTPNKQLPDAESFWKDKVKKKAFSKDEVGLDDDGKPTKVTMAIIPVDQPEVTTVEVATRSEGGILVAWFVPFAGAVKPPSEKGDGSFNHFWEISRVDVTSKGTEVKLIGMANTGANYVAGVVYYLYR